MVSKLWPRTKSYLFLFLCGLWPKIDMELMFFKWLQKWPHNNINFACWPAKPKIVIILLFIERLCQSLVKRQHGKTAQTLKNKDDIVRHLWQPSKDISLHGCHLRRGCFPPPTERELSDNWRRLKILRLVHPSSVPMADLRAPILPYQCLWLAKETS